MTKEYISYISAAIFVLYGLLAAKWIFIGLGLILVFVGLADRLQSKKKPFSVSTAPDYQP